MSSRSELHLEDIRPHLDNAKQSGGKIVARCPLCGKDGHLYLTEKNGKLLVYCQRCNAKGTELFPYWRSIGVKPKEVESVDYTSTEPVEDYRHEYKMPDGSVAFYKRRRKWKDGHKTFSFAYRDGTGNVQHRKPEGSPNLYNLDRLKEATAETTLYIVEGEKCADAMVKAGYLATTTCTGAQKNLKLTDLDRAALAKFPKKILIPDNDEKGMDYAKSFGDSVQVLPMTVIWPACPAKGDIADYLAQGGDPEQITKCQLKPVGKKVSLDREYIESLDKYQLVEADLLDSIFAIDNPAERERALTLLRFRAQALGASRNFNQCWKAHCQQAASKGIQQGDNSTNFPLQPFKLRAGEWAADIGGIRKLVAAGQDYKTVYASPIPVMPLEVLVNVEDRTEKLRLGIFKDGSWSSIVVPRSQCASATKIIELADLGLEVNSDNSKLLVKYLADTVALNPDILPRTKSVEHMGWQGNEFVPYTSELCLDTEMQFRSLKSAIATAGTLPEWAAYMVGLRDNLYLRLTMAASFASVLIERVNALPFVFHLWGGTGSGKTVGLMVAASIWGNPGWGKLVRTMNMTVNSMMATASVLRNLPFFGDELQTIKSRYENYDTLIMRVCEGIDRGRMTNAVLQKQKTWSNAFIFTGEEPCTRSDSGGGVKNRVLEIECDTPVVTNGNAVVGFLNSHYGCAGKVYVDYLGSKTDEELQAAYQSIQGLILSAAASSGAATTEKQAGSMALLMLADTLAMECLWPNEGVDKMLQVEAMIKLLAKAEEVDPAERAYRMLVDLIAENHDKFDVSDNLDRDVPKILWGRIDSSRVLINKSVLERELARMGFEFNAVKKKWAAKGYLELTKQGRYAAKLSVCNVTSYYIALRLDKGA